MATINRRLNIVDEVTTEDGSTLHVHSTPIRREVYDQHYMLLTKTISRMYEQGLPPMMGARIALKLVRDVATELGDDVRTRLDTLLLPEIWRLTNVLVLGESGWQMLPFDKAIKDGLIDEDDADTIRNHLVFFTAASWVHTREELTGVIYPMMLSGFGARTTSSSCSDYMSSLPISTLPETTGETATVSSTIS